MQLGERLDEITGTSRKTILSRERYGAVESTTVDIVHEPLISEAENN